MDEPKVKTGHKELGQFDGTGGYQPIKLPFVKSVTAEELDAEINANVEHLQSTFHKGDSFAGSDSPQQLKRLSKTNSLTLSQKRKELEKIKGAENEIARQLKSKQPVLLQMPCTMPFAAQPGVSKIGKVIVKKSGEVYMRI